MTDADSGLKYFAVADHETAAMTFWRRDGRGDLIAWPRGTDYGPVLWKRPGPGHRHVVPASLVGLSRRTWVRHWYATVRGEWLARLHATIDADPITAASRFAAFHSVCFCCGRVLEDAKSRAQGVGPDCAAKLPVEILQASAREVGRALAARERGQLEAAYVSTDRIAADAVARLRDQVA